MSVSQELAQGVRNRAAGRCQYCRMHEDLQGATFHIEHVIPKCKSGSSRLENLALACPSCNLHKSIATHGIDPVSGETISLFDPNHDRWTQHFRFIGFELHGLTSCGRATIAALKMNSARRQQIRQAEQAFGLFPP